MTDDKEAQKARAKRLKKQIEELKTPEPKDKPENDAPSSRKNESPRSFIQRRMQELEKEDKPTPE